jgi:hypothetical protein
MYSAHLTVAVAVEGTFEIENGTVEVNLRYRIPHE